MSAKKFSAGTVVVFDPTAFAPEYWNNLPEEKKMQYYGSLGYGQPKPKFFVFLCEVRNAPGHCILVSLSDQKIETMQHTDEFREVRDEDEF